MVWWYQKTGYVQICLTSYIADKTPHPTNRIPFSNPLVPMTTVRHSEVWVPGLEEAQVTTRHTTPPPSVRRAWEGESPDECKSVPTTMPQDTDVSTKVSPAPYATVWVAVL